METGHEQKLEESGNTLKGNFVDLTSLGQEPNRYAEYDRLKDIEKKFKLICESIWAKVG